MIDRRRAISEGNLKSNSGTRNALRNRIQRRFFPGIPENADQFDFQGVKHSTPVEIVVGVDFGTSLTKVIVRPINYPLQYAVSFGAFSHESSKYLLPTRLFIRKDGTCSLKPISGSSVLTDIKVGLMDMPSSRIELASGPSCNASAIEVATAYLALVLRYVRCWFIASKGEIFGDHSLNWSYNLGLPAAIDDDPELRETYETVGQSAWIASRRSGQITISAIRKAINDLMHSNYKDEELSCDIDFIPEVIAEVIGYAKSEAREEGLHLLVDIGASTLDICSINLHEFDGEDNYSILTADLGMLGVLKLHQIRIEEIKKIAGTRITSIGNKQNPIGIIPNSSIEYLPKKLKNREEIL